jgi:hypothetical protein
MISKIARFHGSGSMPLGSETGSLLFGLWWRHEAFETGISIDSPPDACGDGSVKMVTVLVVKSLPGRECLKLSG